MFFSGSCFLEGTQHQEAKRRSRKLSVRMALEQRLEIRVPIQLTKILSNILTSEARRLSQWFTHLNLAPESKPSTAASPVLG